jgi:hypothetical protein
MLQYYDAGSLDPHASLVNPVSQTASTHFFPRDSRIKIKPELHLIRHRVIQGFVKGRCTRLDWIPCFVFTTQEVGLATPILSDLDILFVEFDPNKVTPELECNLSSSGRTTKWIENYASADRWQVGFPAYGHRFSGNILPPGILPT